MEKFIELLNNSAFTGLLGLVIGGLITFLGGFVQSIYNANQSDKNYYREQKTKKENMIYEKKELAYLEYMQLFDSYQQALLANLVGNSELKNQRVFR